MSDAPDQSSRWFRYREKLGQSANRLKGLTQKASNQSRDYLATVKHTANQATERYQQSGAKKYVDAAQQHTSEAFDTVSGKAMYDAVQERLAVQDRLNDVLADKLQEALDRIDRLERRLAELEKRDGDAGDGNH